MKVTEGALVWVDETITGSLVDGSCEQAERKVKIIIETTSKNLYLFMKTLSVKISVFFKPDPVDRVWLDSLLSRKIDINVIPSRHQVSVHLQSSGSWIGKQLLSG